MPALTLTTDRLVLRRFTPADAGFIYELFSHEDEMRFVPAGPMACEADALAYLEKEYLRWYRAADAGERGKYDTPLDLRFAICLKDDAAAGDAASGTSATADGAVSELAGAPLYPLPGSARVKSVLLIFGQRHVLLHHRAKFSFFRSFRRDCCQLINHYYEKKYKK